VRVIYGTQLMLIRKNLQLVRFRVNSGSKKTFVIKKFVRTNLSALWLYTVMFLMCFVTLCYTENHVNL
jgi:hypothetical protein